MGGLAILLTGLLPTSLVIPLFPAIMIAIAVIPIVYSWRYYKKQLARGDELKPFPTTNAAAIVTIRNIEKSNIK